MSLRSRLLLLPLGLALIACGSARRSEPLTGEFIAATLQIERGRVSFHRHCHRCHTGGEAALAPALNNKPLPGFMLRMQIRMGLGAMPAFNHAEVDDSELDDLVAYVQALRRHSE